MAKNSIGRRTTLTLDKDVMHGVDQVKQEFPNKPFKQIINEVMRNGLHKKDLPPPERFQVKSHSIGLREDLNFNKIEEVLDILDGAARR